MRYSHRKGRMRSGRPAITPPRQLPTRRRKPKSTHHWHKRRMRRVYVATIAILLAIVSVGLALGALSLASADMQTEVPQ